MLCTGVHEPYLKPNPTLFLPPDMRRVINPKKLNKFVEVCCPHCKAVFMADDPWLHTKEAAPIVGFEADTLLKWRYLDKFDIPFVRVGRAIRYPLSGLIRFKAKLRRKLEAQLMPQ